MREKNTTLFVDQKINSAEILISGLKPKDTTYFLSGSGDPLSEIASALSGRRNVDRLVILAHGSPGTIEFSGKRIDCAAMRYREGPLAKIKAALAPDAELILASCATGAGRDGAHFVEALETALGVPVSAPTADLGGEAGWEALPVLASLFGSATLQRYPHRLALFDFESVSGSGTATLTQTVSSVTVTATRSDGGTLTTSATGSTGNFLDSGSTVNGTMTLTFSAPVTVTALSYWEAGAPANTGGNYVLTPSSGTASVVAETSITGFHEDLTPGDWTGITTITVSYSGGGNYFAGVDQITFTVLTSATSTGAGFNTTSGTSLTPSFNFGSLDETLTIADASHVSGSTADGGGGTDTLVAANGSDFSGFASLTNFEVLTPAAGATVTMSESQYEAFTTVNGNTGTETIVLSSANGDGNVTGDADIEAYTLNGAFTFTIGTGGQSVTGNDADSQTVQSTAAVDTLSGTLNGGTGGSDTLVLDTGDNIAGAMVSNFENLTLGSGASVTMTAAQHDSFSGTVTAVGTEQITLAATGGDTAVTGNSAIETYVLGANGITFTLGAAGQNLTGSSGADTVNVGGLTTTGTLNGGTGTDTLQLGTGADITGSTLSSFENLTLTSGASVTMTATQNAGFSGTITAAGNETVTITGDGSFTTLANTESYSVGDDSTNARTITLGGAGTSVTASSTTDAVTFSAGGLTLTGTLTGDSTVGDTLELTNNSNISSATITNIGTASVASGASVTMTEVQHDGFTAINGTGTNQITLSSANGDANVSGDADIEIYVLGAATSFALGAAAQNVTGSTGNDTVNGGGLTATGTLSGGLGTDILQLSTGANISGATVSSFETLTLSGGASVTMTEAQHDAFSTVNAAGTDTITISAATNGFATNTAVENYALGVANAVTIAGGAQDLTGSGGNDTITFQGLTYTGTLSGGAGTDVIQATNGTDISGATISGVENLTLAGNASVTMNLSQFNAFSSGTITAGGTETVTLSGDGNVSTTANLEVYNVGDDSTNTRTVTITNAGHSVSATSTTDAVTFDAGGLTLTGTLTGDGTVNDILSLGTGANISGATISNIEDLTLTSGGSATMTVAQLNGFTGTITAAGTNTVTLTATGTVSGTNLGAIETLSTAGGGSETITLAASIAAGKTLTAADTGNDHFVVTGSAGAQSVTGSAGVDTIDGGAGADTLAGGAGADRLTGGDDTDRFTGSVSDLNGDTITDLASGETILLTGVTGLSTANVRFNGTSLEVDTNATTFAAPEVAIGTVSDLTSALTVASVADSGGNTLITLGSASVSATTTAAGFNTTNGTNLNPASTFGATDDTLTIADASHITSASVANGGAGTDTIVLADGGDLTTTGFTLTGFEVLTPAAGATVTMSESQYEGFTTVNGNTGTETIVLSSANGDGAVTGDADIETYTLNAAFTFTLGAAGQNVTGSAGANQTVQSSASIDTLTGTLNGGAGGSDTLILDDGDNLSGSTVSNFENLTLGSGASVTMTAAQLNGFTGTTTAAGTETVTLSATGSIASANVTPIETLATAADAGAQTINLTAAQAAGKTLTAGDSGLDHFVITGSAGSQSVTGSAGGDTLDGGAGDDTVIGGGRDDAVSGGAGNDVVSGGSGFDTLVGGDGADTLTGSASDFNGDTISDFAVGDSIVVTGKDLSALNGTTASGTIDISGSVATTLTGITSASGTFSATLAGGNTTITLVAPASDGDSGGGGTIVVTPTTPTTGSGGSGTTTAQTITNNGSNSGSAAIVENTNNNGNLVTATLPPSTTITSEGPSTAQSPTDALTTLVTSIQARGSTAETPLVSGARTFLNNLATTTTLDVRTIVPTTTTSSLSSPIVITGTNGGSQSEAFVIDMRSLPSGSNLQLDNIEFASVMGSSTVTGGNGDNYVTADDSSQFISLGVGNDTLFGGDGADTIGSGSGADQLHGEDGNDRVFGGTDTDTVSGGAHEDVVYGNQANDVVYGNQGYDTLYGGQNEDSLYGGQHQDLLYGNNGQDLLYGNLGEDTLYGGQGDDTLFGGQGLDVLNGNDGADNLSGGDGADTLIGGDGNDTLYGGLSSANGGDGTSFDILSGGAGDDVFHGGEGVDWIFTGAGADKIYVDDLNGIDVVADFGLTEDQIVIRSTANGQTFTSAADVIARAADNADGDVEIDLGGQYVRLIGVQASDLTESMFGFY